MEYYGIQNGGDILAYLMKCGHVANATDDSTGSPVCAICFGITKDAEVVVGECFGTNGLEGRKAVCVYGGHGEINSSWDLPFFEYRPHMDYDKYYCGCMGWD